MSELEYWKSRLAGGKVSRREFIGRAAALGLTTALATTLASKISGAEPKKGGSAKFGLAHGATTDSLDPGTWPDTFTQTSFWGSTCNGLTDIDTKGNIVGDLAETMEPSKGATEWIFKLRKGVTFHNGKNLTSADVLASFNHHRAENSKSAVKSVLAPIADIKADGADTVVFTLKDASADFPYLTSDYHIPILPAKDDGTLDWQSGIGTGAFILEKFEPGVSAKEKRNPNYHKSGLPYFDEVEFLALTDVTARTNALTTGEVQFIGRCDLKTLNLLQRNKDLEIDEVTGYGHYVLPMDTTQKPFDDVNVRTALKYALDREEVVRLSAC